MYPFSNIQGSHPYTHVHILQIQQYYLRLVYFCIFYIPKRAIAFLLGIHFAKFVCLTAVICACVYLWVTRYLTSFQVNLERVPQSINLTCAYLQYLHNICICIVYKNIYVYTYTSVRQQGNGISRRFGNTNKKLKVLKRRLNIRTHLHFTNHGR